MTDEIRIDTNSSIPKPASEILKLIEKVPALKSPQVSVVDWDLVVKINTEKSQTFSDSEASLEDFSSHNSEKTEKDQKVEPKTSEKDQIKQKSHKELFEEMSAKIKKIELDSF